MADVPDVSKEDFLAQLGYGGDIALPLLVLEEAGLTNPRKTRINAAKRADAERLLAERLIRVCNRGDCRTAAARDGRAIADASAQAFCEVCGGSAQRDAVDRMVRACAARGVTRVCVVGGSPEYRTVLEERIAGRIELRLVDGQTARTRRDADADLRWAHLVLIWGPTELDHKVSTLYTGPTVVTVRKRGIAQLADEAIRFAHG